MAIKGKGKLIIAGYYYLQCNVYIVKISIRDTKLFEQLNWLRTYVVEFVAN